ncbi:MAG: hypothetical protein V1903_03375 [Bacteroidota bacterium]
MAGISIFHLLMAISAVLYAQDQDEKYPELMKETIIMMDTATTVYHLQGAANQFERIGNAMQTQWLPFYYTAYCYVQISHKVKSDNMRDLNIEKAEELISRADQLSPENSEIWVMKGFILQAKMSVDPMTRGFKYNKTCLETFRKARELDSENPRSYLWEGVNLFNTPSFMGGGKEKALPLIEKSIEKFETFHLHDSISPDWGKQYALMILAKCKN